MSGPVHALTVDVEDWYHGLRLDRARWPSLEKRVHVGIERLLDLLSEHRTRATFFILGDVAGMRPDMAKRIAGAGHEVGTHGGSHEALWDVDAPRFARALRDSVKTIQDATGCAVAGHRAPYFSVDSRTSWALDALLDAGIAYDSSVFPMAHSRYGVPSSPLAPHRLRAPSGREIVEFPLAVARAFGRRVPVAGGAYLRVWPLAVMAWGLRRIEREGRSAVLYLHPWELDPHHPRVPIRVNYRATHYHRLRTTEGKLRFLLRRFRFGAVRDVFARELSEPSALPLSTI